VFDDRTVRRLRRLREELLDEEVPVALDGREGAAFLEELDYARRPSTHEGISPRFGALIVPSDVIDPDRLGFPALVHETDLEPDVVRRLADGRTSFVARTPHKTALVSFDRTIEHEATAVQVATAAGLTVIQRLQSGWVRIFAPHAVMIWDGARWWGKPLAEHLARAVRAVRPELASPVLDGLAEFCVHWLSAGPVGAMLVWQTEPDGPLGHLGYGASLTIPTLDMTERQDYPALLNVLAQTDRAALVSPDGRLDQIGIALRASDEAVAAVTAYRGTRHTSALRFTYDEPSTVVFVVSSSGPVTVLHGGKVISVAPTTPPMEVAL
jgi:hypothetical protein